MNSSEINRVSSSFFFLYQIFHALLLISYHMQYAHGTFIFLRSCTEELMVHDRHLSFNRSPFLPTDRLLCYSSPQSRQERKTPYSTGEMSQVLPMDRSWGYQRYGEQGNIISWPFHGRIRWSSLFCLQVKELHWYGYFAFILILLTSLVWIRWKHAAACHQDSTLPGESEYYETDDVLTKLLSLNLGHATT